VWRTDDGVTYFQPNLAVDEAGRVAISAFALADGRIDEILLLSPPRQGITASAGAFHLVWNDTRTGNMDLFAATVRP
jgi:hypothetical protein